MWLWRAWIKDERTRNICQKGPLVIQSQPATENRSNFPSRLYYYYTVLPNCCRCQRRTVVSVLTPVPPNALEFYFAFEMGQINYYFYIIYTGILPVFSRSKIYCKPVSAKLSLAHVFLRLTLLVSLFYSFPTPNSFPLHLESCISFRYKTPVCVNTVFSSIQNRVSITS